MEVDNPYRYCNMMVSLASELWVLEYSKRIVSENYYNYSKKYFLNSYYDAKKNVSMRLVKISNLVLKFLLNRAKWQVIL